MLQGGDGRMQVGRATYVIDPDRRIRLVVIYPESTGRNFDEILRAVDSLQLASEYGLATPVNWVRGQDVLIPPDLSDREVDQLFPKGYKSLNHYIRTAADPMQQPMH